MKLMVTVDEIDNGYANLLIRTGTDETPFAVVPCAALPADISAGDILLVTFKKEEEATRAARQRVAELHAELAARNR